MSAQSTLIITTARVKEITGQADGVEDRKMGPCMKEAQHALEQILGTTLYALVEAAYPTFTGDYDTLYDEYIEPFLAYKSVARSFPKTFAEQDRNGVLKRSGANGDFQSVTMKELAMVQADPEGIADNFQGKMLKWLNDLDADNAIKVAFLTDVDCEPRIKRTDRGNVPLRRSRWQDQDGYRRSKYRRWDEY